MILVRNFPTDLHGINYKKIVMIFVSYLLLQILNYYGTIFCSILYLKWFLTIEQESTRIRVAIHCTLWQHRRQLLWTCFQILLHAKLHWKWNRMETLFFYDWPYCLSVGPTCQYHVASWLHSNLPLWRCMYTKKATHSNVLLEQVHVSDEYVRHWIDGLQIRRWIGNSLCCCHEISERMGLAKRSC